MKVIDMIKKIDFHDSNLIELLHENDKVKLKIELCMWRQVGYKEGEDELKEVSLEFDSVTDYIWDARKSEEDIDYDIILVTSYDDGILKIVLYDDDDGGVSVISFKCNKVEFTYID